MSVAGDGLVIPCRMETLLASESGVALSLPPHSKALITRTARSMLARSPEVGALIFGTRSLMTPATDPSHIDLRQARMAEAADLSTVS